MSNFEFILPCLFGLEAVLKRELQDMGYNVTSVEDGRVSFSGDAKALVEANLKLRTAERVLLKVTSFKATSFEELYQGILSVPWESYLPKEAKFWVTKATSIKSALFSPSDIQSITKKAIVERLKGIYKVPWFEETGADYPIRIFIKKDEVEVTIDTSGDGLHKRGYREHASRAPIRETLAAGIVLLSVWNKERLLIDPFCGSGTLLIEAAMIGAHMAPGLNRHFVSEHWETLIPKKLWLQVADAAIADERPLDLQLQGYDFDERVLRIARQNAALAGVSDYIHFQERDVHDFSSPKSYGVIITNPPYGERLEDQTQVEKLYTLMGEKFSSYDTWSKYIITSYEGFETAYGMQASKKRKLYSGMLKTNLYQYLGSRPPRKAK